MGKLKFEAGRGRFLEIQETVSITEVQVDTTNYPEDLGKSEDFLCSKNSLIL